VIHFPQYDSHVRHQYRGLLLSFHSTAICCPVFELSFMFGRAAVLPAHGTTPLHIFDLRLRNHNETAAHQGGKKPDTTLCCDVYNKLRRTRHIPRPTQHFHSPMLKILPSHQHFQPGSCLIIPSFFEIDCLSLLRVAAIRSCGTSVRRKSATEEPPSFHDRILARHFSGRGRRSRR